MEDIKKKLWDVKWNLVVMAVFCFAFAVYAYVTPVEGGPGTFMITPHDGLEGLLKMIPWCSLVLGVLGLITPFASKSTWVLSWLEPLLGLFMFVFGFWELFFPYDINVFSQTFAFVGIFLAFYVMFIALEMDRKNKGHWFVTLVLAAVIWIVSFFNLMNFAGEGASQGLTCLEFFLAGWGFTYGAIVLSGVAPEHGDNVVCPFRKKADKKVVAA